MAKSKHIPIKQTDKQPTPLEGQDAAPIGREATPPAEKDTTLRTPDGRTLETDPRKGRVTEGHYPGLDRFGRFIVVAGFSAPILAPGSCDVRPTPERLEMFWQIFLELERLCGVRLRTGGNFWDLLVIYNNAQGCDLSMRRNVFRNLAKSRLGDLVDVVPDPILAPHPDVKILSGAMPAALAVPKVEDKTKVGRPRTKLEETAALYIRLKNGAKMKDLAKEIAVSEGTLKKRLQRYENRTIAEGKTTAK